jgi:hypothetical protein
MSVGVIPAAESSSLQIMGARVGVSDYEKRDRFMQEEVFVQRDLPWRWEKFEATKITTALELSLGHLGAEGDDAFVGGIGPVVRAGWAGGPFFVGFGCKATFISRHRIATVNFGGKAQFVSHFEAGVELSRNWEVAYRYQHMSNARVYKSNPGINLHVLAVQYRF